MFESFGTALGGAWAAADYVLVKNPVSQTLINSAKTTVDSIMANPKSTPPGVPQIPSHLRTLQVDRLVFSGNPYIRLAGLSGAAAVCLGAYGAHSLLLKPGLEERKRVYETANRYHFFHSLALMGLPLSRHPKTALAFFSLGMLLFCGTCYYDAFTGDTKFRKYTPIGGTMLIAGWLCLVL